MTTPSFWRGKKVFLTGHTGFKGAWMARVLTNWGAAVSGFSLPAPTSPALSAILGTENDITHTEGDVRDAAAVTRALHAADPDIVIHMAAQPLVRLSYRVPVETFGVNVMGTAHVLEAARETKARATVIVTTDKCYLNEETGRFFTEDDKLGGYDPYSASKAAAEIVAAAYDHSFYRSAGRGLATARAGNVIGGGDWAADRLIPDVVRAAGDGTAVKIRNPAATRPWQHVLEPVFGYLLLAEKLYEDADSFRGGWNFGPEASGIQSVETVLTLLKETLPFQLELDRGPQPHEAKTLGLDINHAKTHLGWQPRLTLAEAVSWTGSWYKTFIDGGDVKTLTDRQINEYLHKNARAAA